jgi:hypothetical protein
MANESVETGLRHSGEEVVSGVAAMLSLVEAAEAVEEGLETELAEARREADGLRARLAALEALIPEAIEDAKNIHDEFCQRSDDGCAARIASMLDALSGGTQALDAVVAAALASERAAIRARVEALHRLSVADGIELLNIDHVLAAIGASEGGAP